MQAQKPATLVSALHIGDCARKPTRGAGEIDEKNEDMAARAIRQGGYSVHHAKFTQQHRAALGVPRARTRR